MAFNTIAELIQDVRLGKMVILMDDEDRENEGDLVMAAECVRPQDINFMATHARGLICMPMSRERGERLNLPLMVQRNLSGFGTKFTVSIEAAEGVSTGISAADRAHTVRTAAAPYAKASDIVQPGHIFPLLAEDGGVLVRAGHTEAACDLARMAGFEAAGVICEILNEDGSMARRPDLEQFAAQHQIKIGTIADLIHYRVLNESTIEKLSEGPVQTEYGPFTLHAYRDLLKGDVHFALVSGPIDRQRPTLVRVHVAAALRDLIGTQPPHTPPGWNIHRCMERVARDGGVVVLLAGEESPSDLLASVDIAMGRTPTTASMVDGGHNTYMTVGLGSQILRDIGVGQIRLMGAQIRYNAISGFDLEVVEFLKPDAD